MKLVKVLLALLAIGFVAAGCSTAEESKNSGSTERTIYTSLYPLQYIVEKIGGETVQTKSVFPPGGDAHTYEPSSKDMTSIADSDAFIYLGAGLEAFAQTAADSLTSQDVELIEIGEHEELFITSEHDHHHDEDHEHEGEEHGDDHHHGDRDPHIWLDPLRMIEMAKIITDELTALYPEEAAVYEKNYEELEADLQALDETYQEVLEGKEDKHILVSHASFGYWEERYGVEQLSVSGLSTEQEPSQKELTEIINQVEENNLEYILFEQSGTTRVAQVIQEETELDALTLHTLEVLTDEDVNKEEDYISLMEMNLETLDQVTK